MQSRAKTGPEHSDEMPVHAWWPPFGGTSKSRLIAVAVVLVGSLALAGAGILAFLDELLGVKAIELPKIETSSINSGLLALTKTVIIPDNALEMVAGTASSIAVDGDHVLIADRFGRFYAADIKGRSAVIARASIDLDTNFRQMLDAAVRVMGEEKTVGESFFVVGVTDLLIREGGSKLLAAYSHWDDERSCVTVRLSEADLSDDQTSLTTPWRLVFETAPCLEPTPPYFGGLQAGGRLAEPRPGVILLTVGDFSIDGLNAREETSQDPATSYGKIYEIDLGTGASRVVSIGHRNPQGLAVDDSGNIWETEHGPQGGDEINLILEGRNYGWPKVTFGTQYGSDVWPISQTPGRHDGFEPPVYAWMPSIGISNLIQIDGFAPPWDGDLLVASLGGRTLYRLRMEDGRVVYAEPIKMDYRIRDLGQLADGRILMWVDRRRLMILEPERFSNEAAEVIATLDQDVQNVLARCEECHRLGPARENDTRISLWGVHGRALDAGDPALKSESLRSAGGTWNTGRLDAFLADPQRVVPGTAMPGAGLDDDRLRARVVGALEEMTDTGAAPGS